MKHLIVLNVVLLLGSNAWAEPRAERVQLKQRITRFKQASTGEQRRLIRQAPSVREALVLAARHFADPALQQRLKKAGSRGMFVARRGVQNSVAAAGLSTVIAGDPKPIEARYRLLARDGKLYVGGVERQAYASHPLADFWSQRTVPLEARRVRKLSDLDKYFPGLTVAEIADMVDRRFAYLP